MYTGPRGPSLWVMLTAATSAARQPHVEWEAAHASRVGRGLAELRPELKGIRDVCLQ